MRIVLDTNELVRALMRPAELATFIMAWQSARFEVVSSPELLTEYEYVLAYPEIASAISPESLRAFRSHLIDNIVEVAISSDIKICRDPDDDKVIATAVTGAVDLLLTQDEDLLTTDVLTFLLSHDVRVSTVDKLLIRLDKQNES